MDDDASGPGLLSAVAHRLPGVPLQAAHLLLWGYDPRGWVGKGAAGGDGKRN